MDANEYKVSIAKCITYAAELRADDPRFNQDVEVTHEDGSHWYMRCGFWMPDPENHKYMWVITEHFGEMVFDVEDVTLRVYETGPVREVVVQQACAEHGYTNPFPLKCTCGGCDGDLRYDAPNKKRTLTFVECTKCKCCSTIEGAAES